MPDSNTTEYETSRLRGALREVVDACSALLPWGGRDDETAQVQQRGPIQIAIQTALVTGLAAAGASLKIALYGSSTPGAWMLVLILLTVPLTLGTAAKPANGRRGLIVGLICGALAGGLVLAALASVSSGFWLIFAAAASGFAVANLVFAVVIRRVTRRRPSTGKEFKP